MDIPLGMPLDAVYDLDFGNAQQEMEEQNILKTIDAPKTLDRQRNATTEDNLKRIKAVIVRSHFLIKWTITFGDSC